MRSSLFPWMFMAFSAVAFPSETQTEKGNVLLKVLEQLGAHYFRPLTSTELNALSLQELFSSLDQKTHLEAVRPSSPDFVRGLEKENSISPIAHPREDVGYVRITFFGRRTPDDLNPVLKALQKQGTRNLILDLRENSGGSLESGVAVIAHFISSDKWLFTYRGRDQIEVKRYSPKAAAKISLENIFVLIDKETASTAEMVADSLRRYAQARLIGEPTRGKRSIQEAFPIDASNILFLTTGYFRLLTESPSGKVEPDYFVESDNALQKAMELKEEEGFS